MFAGAALAAGLVLGAAGAAEAGTYVFALSGSGFTGGGTIVTGTVPQPELYSCPTCAVGPAYLVTSISGLLNGHAISGLPVGTFAGNNNLLYPTVGGPYLDFGDLGFTADGVDYNAFQGNSYGPIGYFLAASNIAGVFTSPISFTLRDAVPEPATWGMMLVGLGAAGAAVRAARRRRTTVTA